MRSKLFSFRDRKLKEFCYQMQSGENPVNKDHCVTMQIFLSNCVVKRDTEMRNSGIELVPAKKDMNLQRLNVKILQTEIR